MNSRERLLAAIRLQQPDRLPCSPLVVPKAVEQMTDDEWQALIAHTDVTFSTSVLGDTEIFLGTQGIEATRVTREGRTTLQKIETPMGVLSSKSVATKETNWVAEHLGKGDVDVGKVLSVPYTPPTYDLSPYWHWTDVIGEEGLVYLGMPSAFRFVLGFFGPQALYERIADDPDGIEHLIATFAERVEVYVRGCCEAGVRHFWMGGAEHCGPGVVSPRIFRRMTTPYDRRIVALIHCYGGTVNYHVHAKLRDILDDIAEIGPDVLSPVETGLRGDVTLAEAKARIGTGSPVTHRVCLKGNLDDMAFLALASEDEVRMATAECVSQAAAGGGYILSGTDATIYSPHWVQSFLVMAELAREYEYG